jgi:hypothetical protein
MNGDFLGVDPELSDLFPGEPDLLDLANTIRGARPEAPQVDRFQAELRGRLMQEAPAHLRPRGLRRMFGGHGGLVFAGAGAALGAAMIAIVLVSTTRSNNDSVVVAINARAAIAGNTHVDPNQLITIDFNQAMDHQSVERSIHIQPATSFTATWSSNTLTIKPVNQLAANTGYTVRLEPATVHAANPAAQPLTKPIVVAFGTGAATTPTPPPAPAVLPVSVFGPAGQSGVVVAVPTGVLAADAPAPTPSPSPSASAPASASPSASGSASPGATATATPAPAPPALVRYDFAGNSTAIGPAAQALAVAPGSRSLAAVVALPGGGVEVVLSGLDGSGSRVLTTRADAGSPLDWYGSTRLVFTGEGRLRSVDLNGVVRDLGQAATPQTVVLASNGRYAAFCAPPAATPSPSPAPTASGSPAATSAPAGTLVDLANAGAPPISLPGCTGPVAFSGDSLRVAWLATSDTFGLQASRVIRMLPISQTGTTSGSQAVALPDGIDSIGGLALSPDGGRLAVMATLHTPASELIVIDSATSSVIGVAAGPIDHPVFGDPATVFATRRGGAGGDAVIRVALPAVGSTTPAASTTVPPEADALLDRLIAAQVAAQSGNHDALAQLPVAGADPVALTPRGITQAYVVSETRSTGASTVIAEVRLVHVPTQSGSSDPVTSADETVTFDRQTTTSTGYAITGMSVGQFAAEPAGPHVSHVAMSGLAGARVLQVRFDGDLDPRTVTSSVSLLDRHATHIDAPVSYDAATRTVTVTVPASAETLLGLGQITLRIDSTLQDVDGNALATPYTKALHA